MSFCLVVLGLLLVAFWAGESVNRLAACSEKGLLAELLLLH